MVPHRAVFQRRGEHRLDFGIAARRQNRIQARAFDFPHGPIEKRFARRIGQDHPPEATVPILPRLQRQNRVVTAGENAFQHPLGKAGTQQPLALHRIGDGAAQLLAIQAPLDQKILRPQAHRLDGKGLVVIAGDHQDRHSRRGGQHRLQDPQPLPVGQAEVQQNRVVLRRRQTCPRTRQIVGQIDPGDRVAALGKKHLGEAGVQGIVLDQQHGACPA